MDRAMRVLLDKDQIVETLNRLFISVDRRDWTAAMACLANEVLMDMTSMTGGQPERQSPQQIVDGWESGLRELKAMHHQAGNYIVRVDGDEATCFCYGIATHYLPNESGRNTRALVGSYDTHLIRAEGRWRIDRFRFDLKYVDGNANLEGRPASRTA